MGYKEVKKRDKVDRWKYNIRIGGMRYSIYIHCGGSSLQLPFCIIIIINMLESRSPH